MKSEILLNYEKEENPAVCDNIDGPKGSMLSGCQGLGMGKRKVLAKVCKVQFIR